MCAQSNQTPHRGINRVAAACWIIGALGLIGALTGIKRVWYGPELAIVRHTPAERAIVAAIGLGAVIVGLGCRRRRPFAWWSLAGLAIAFILGVGWQLVRHLAAPWPTPLFGTLEALVQLGPAALLLWWWWLQRFAFSPSATQPNPVPPPSDGWNERSTSNA